VDIDRLRALLDVNRSLMAELDADAVLRHLLDVARGVLGVLIDDPRPLRLDDVGAHPHSYGVPAGHPRMHTFLGVPITIRGQVWGNLYLTEKRGGALFSADDEEIVCRLADAAAVAIENSRRWRARGRSAAAPRARGRSGRRRRPCAG
jgi:GAF domain-containing protein